MKHKMEKEKINIMLDFGTNRYTIQWLKRDSQGLWYIEKENYLFMPFETGERNEKR